MSIWNFVRCSGGGRHKISALDWLKRCVLCTFEEILISMIAMSTVFCDVTPCSLVEVYRRFGGT
jgi:hypothetical protein